MNGHATSPPHRKHRSRRVPAACAWSVFLVALILSTPALAQRRQRPPEIAATFPVPSAVAPGGASIVTFHGAGVGRGGMIWSTLPGGAQRMGADERDLSPEQARYEFNVPAGTPVGVHVVRLSTGKGVSPLVPIMVDDLPTIVEASRNRSPQTAQRIDLNRAVDGTSDELGFDYFNIRAAAGQRLSIDVVAQRIGSRMDPVLRLLDPKGREVAYCEDDPAVGNDCRVAHVAGLDGDYLIELRDINYTGGNANRYRLRVGDFPVAPVLYPLTSDLSDASPRQHREHEPNDEQAAESIGIVPAIVHGMFDRAGDVDRHRFEARKGQLLSFKARTRSLGSPADVRLRLLSGSGTRVVESKPEAADELCFAYAFNDDGNYILVVEELNRRGGNLPYRIEISPDNAAFDLSVDIDRIDATPGGQFTVKVTAVRRNYNGAITLAIPEFNDTSFLESAVIPAGKTETDLKVKLSPGAKIGRPWHFTIVGHATINGSYTQATASTVTALRRLWPQIVYAPQWDGLIGLSVALR